MARSSSSFAALAAVVALLAATAASAAGEKETHLRVFWHDVVSAGSNVSTVAHDHRGPGLQRLRHGVRLTEGPDLAASRLLGHAQGMYVNADNARTHCRCR